MDRFLHLLRVLRASVVHSWIRARAARSLIAGTAGLVLLSGCATAASIKYYSYPRNPIHGVEKVAVVPFGNFTRAQVDMLAFSETFASELVQFQGMTVIRPTEAWAKAKEGGYALPPASTAEAVKLAKFLGADAIVVGGITEYDPYYPPRVAVAAQMIGVKRFSLRSVDVDRLIPSGKPFKVDAGRQDLVIAALEKVYDSNFEITRVELRGYTQAHSGDDHAFPEEDATLRVMERYWRFVSNRMIRALVDQGARRQEEDAAEVAQGGAEGAKEEANRQDAKDAKDRGR